MTLKIYVAGPLFTPYPRALHARNAARLRSAGFICLVPHERSVAGAFEWDTGTPTTPIGSAICVKSHGIFSPAIVYAIQLPTIHQTP